MMGRPAGKPEQEPAQPDSAISLPVKNNKILAELLDVLGKFNEQVDAQQSKK